MERAQARRLLLGGVVGVVALLVGASVIAASGDDRGGTPASTSRTRPVVASTVPTTTVSTTPSPATVAVDEAPVVEAPPPVEPEPRPSVVTPSEAPPPEEVHAPYSDPPVPTFPLPCAHGDTRPGTDGEGNPILLTCIGGTWSHLVPVK